MHRVPRIQILLLPLVATFLALSSSRATAQDAEYLVVFDATWSAQTHPIDFPNGAHFSPLIGGVHGGNVLFWQDGALASAGMERMAETGSTSPLDTEIEAAINSGDALEVIRGGGTDSPGEVRTRLRANAAFSRVTLVTMIAPSPDWFVGVSGLELRPNGEWVDRLTVELLPWDAGTDSGVTYTSRNQDTQPPENIQLITTDPVGNGVPLGTFTFLRCDQSYWANYGAGFPGTLGIPELLCSADPTLGSAVDLTLGNSRGATTPGLLFFGLAPDSLPGSWGGDLLVDPLTTLLLSLPTGGRTLPLQIPSDELLCGLSVYFQLLELDPGAARRLSSSAGLELKIGE